MTCLCYAIPTQQKEFLVGTFLKERKAVLRIPSQVLLPFGYRIAVKQLSDAEMDKRDPNADGIWDEDSKTIYIRRRLAVTRRRYILAHELGHAWLDWQHRYLDDGKAST
jgi:Zn-dependent peptidase ImmA (M78 family)